MHKQYHVSELYEKIPSLGVFLIFKTPFWNKMSHFNNPKKM